MKSALTHAKAQLVIFDWDGTLFDSTGVIAHSLQQAALAIGLPAPSTAQAKHVIGLSFDEIIKQLIGAISPEQRAVFIAAYRKTYLSSENLVTLFDGMSDLLTQLKQQGKLLAIATGKSRASLDRVLQHNPDLHKLFSSSRTADQTQSKPHPQMLMELLDEFNTAPQSAVMIGDTTYDIDMAHAAQVASIAVTYGAHDEETLQSAQPTVQARTVSELALLLGAS